MTILATVAVTTVTALSGAELATLAEAQVISGVPTGRPFEVHFRATAARSERERALDTGGTVTSVRAEATGRCDFVTLWDRMIAEQLHALSADHRVDAATQLAFGETERRLSSRRFSEVNAMLNALEPERLLPEVILAVLILTRFERHEMPSRGSFLARAEASLRERLGPDRAERLLASRR